LQDYVSEFERLCFCSGHGVRVDDTRNSARTIGSESMRVKRYYRTDDPIIFMRLPF
jgi:hypothetical protein